MLFIAKVFWLPPDSGEKITLIVTMLLTLTLFLQLITEFTPKAAKSLPIVGLYFNFNLLLILLSVVLTVIVLNLHFRGPRRDKVPNWMRTYLIGYLGFGLRILSKYELKKVKKTKNKELKQFEQLNIFEDFLSSYMIIKNAKEDKKQSRINEQLNKIINSFEPTKIENNNLKMLMLKEILQAQINLVSLNQNKLKMMQDMSLNQIYDEWKILAIIS